MSINKELKNILRIVLTSIIAYGINIKYLKAFYELARLVKSFLVSGSTTKGVFLVATDKFLYGGTK